MAIIRVEKQGNFVSIDKTCIEDSRLSYKAKGLHTYLMIRPDNWKPILAQLSNVSTDKQGSVRSGMKELEKYGYIVRRPIKDNGKIVDWEHTVYEKPQKPSLSPQVGFPQVGKPQVGIPQVENRRLINNDLISNDLINNEAISPPVGEYSSDFETFWKKYPRKAEKKRAYKCYQTTIKKGATQDQLLLSADNYRKQTEIEKTETRYIKHASTFLGINEPWKEYLKVEDIPFLPTLSEQYNSHVGKYTQLIDREAREIIERGLDEQMLIAALAVAVQRNKATWPYIKGICNRWLDEGITTWEQWQEGQYAQRPNRDEGHRLHSQRP